MEATEINFKKYIREKKEAGSKRDGSKKSNRYAHKSDKALTDWLSNMKTIRFSVESAVKGFVSFKYGELLRHGVRVSPKQFPKVHDTISNCAHTLGIPIPKLFVQYSPVANAYTLGTNTNSLVVLTSGLVDFFSEEELHFVIGHECGHIHNSHVTYGTLMLVLTQLPFPLQIAMEPLKLGLLSWRRKTEITADRAGLICCRDPDVAIKGLARLSLGSSKLDEEYDIDVLLQQTEDLKSSSFIAKLPEYWYTHPHIGRRIKALQIFADSEVYHEIAELERNDKTLLTGEELDQRTSEIVKIL